MAEQSLQVEMLQQILQAIRGHRESTDERFDRLEARMDRLEERMDKLEARMDRLEARMDKLEERMDKLEGRMDKLEGRMDKLETRMDKLEERMDSSEESVQQHFRDINAKIDSQGEEISKLSWKVGQLIDSQEKLHAKVIIHDHDIKRLNRIVRRRCLVNQANS